MIMWFKLKHLSYIIKMITLYLTYRVLSLSKCDVVLNIIDIISLFPSLYLTEVDFLVINVLILLCPFSYGFYFVQ